MQTLTVTLRSHGSHLKSQSHLLDSLRGTQVLPGYDRVVYDFSGVEVIGRRLVKAAVREARLLTLGSGEREVGRVELVGLSPHVANVARLVFRAYLHDAAEHTSGLSLSMPLYPRYGDPRKQALRDDVVRRDGEGCVWCGCELKADQHEATLDHVIPQKDGGRWDIDNLVLACPACNGARAATPADKWLRLCLRRRQPAKVIAVEAAIARMDAG